MSHLMLDLCSDAVLFNKLVVRTLNPKQELLAYLTGVLMGVG